MKKQTYVIAYYYAGRDDSIIMKKVNASSERKAFEEVFPEYFDEDSEVEDISDLNDILEYLGDNEITASILKI